MRKSVDQKIKSIIWDGNDLVIFNTHEHIYYSLINGEQGIIRSLDKIIFLVNIKNDQIVYMNINEEFEEVEIDKSELSMKLAIFNENFEEIEKLLKNEFLGKSMISYLLKKKMNKITQ